MLSCPLATHFETLWLTQDNEHYTRRLTLGVGLSIALHVLMIVGIWFVQANQSSELEQILSTGAPNLPVRVELVTLQKVQNTSPIKPVVAKKAATIIDTAANSTLKVPAQKKPVEKITPKVEKTKPVELKEAVKENQGNAASTSVAGAPQTSLTDGINTTVSLSDPRFISREPPEYPVQAQRRRQQGRVVLLLNVETSGSIVYAQILHSSGFPLLDNAAQKAALTWKMRPFTQDGVPVPRQINVPYDFVIKKG